MSMPALSSHADLYLGLHAARRYGAAFVDQALTGSFRQRLAAEVNAGPFAAMSAYEGRAQQEGELYHLRADRHDDVAAYPSLRQLGEEFRAAVRNRERIPELTGWLPNEIHVQRYPARALGITPHLDLKRYGLLIAIFTAAGSASFTWCADRSGTAYEQWQAGPGSLVLLRAPGLGGADDGRPLHTVSGPETGERISVTFRMNTRTQ